MKLWKYAALVTFFTATILSGISGLSIQRYTGNEGMVGANIIATQASPGLPNTNVDQSTYNYEKDFHCKMTANYFPNCITADYRLYENPVKRFENIALDALNDFNSFNFEIYNLCLKLPTEAFTEVMLRQEMIQKFYERKAQELNTVYNDNISRREHELFMNDWVNCFKDTYITFTKKPLNFDNMLVSSKGVRTGTVDLQSSNNKKTAQSPNTGLDSSLKTPLNPSKTKNQEIVIPQVSDGTGRDVTNIKEGQNMGSQPNQESNLGSNEEEQEFNPPLSTSQNPTAVEEKHTSNNKTAQAPNKDPEVITQGSNEKPEDTNQLPNQSGISITGDNKETAIDVDPSQSFDPNLVVVEEDQITNQNQKINRTGGGYRYEPVQTPPSRETPASIVTEKPNLVRVAIPPKPKTPQPLTIINDNEKPAEGANQAHVENEPPVVSEDGQNVVENPIRTSIQTPTNDSVATNGVAMGIIKEKDDTKDTKISSSNNNTDQEAEIYDLCASSSSGISTRQVFTPVALSTILLTALGGFRL